MKISMKGLIGVIAVIVGAQGGGVLVDHVVPDRVSADTVYDSQLSNTVARLDTHVSDLTTRLDTFIAKAQSIDATLVQHGERIARLEAIQEWQDSHQ